jgi:GT2 family glycosyltransferase
VSETPAVDALAGRTSARPLVSVVMVNLDCGRFFDLVFPSLFAQTHRRFEVIVVDNGSTDGSLDRLRIDYPSVDVIALNENRGFSAATNIGIRRSSGEFVLTLNFDIVLEPTFVEHLVAAMQEDARIGWAAGYVLRMTPAGTTAEIDCAGHHMMRGRFAHGFDLSKPFSKDDYTSASDVFGASACAALYRRAMLDDIADDGEWFDEDFFAYYEDVDVDWRAHHRGWRCRYTPDAVAHHIRRGTELIGRPEIAACELSNRILMMIKNDSPRLLLHDWLPVLSRTARELAGHALQRRRALLIGLGRVIRFAPRMLQKRRAIMARSVAEPHHFRAFMR